MIPLPGSRAEIEETYEFLHQLAAEIGATVQAGKPFVSSISPDDAQRKLRAAARIVLRKHLMTTQTPADGASPGSALPTGRLPTYYTNAAWRNTTPLDCTTARIGVGFTLDSGDTLRLALDETSALHLQETLVDHLTSSHSPSSAGIPSADVSYPPDGVKV